MNDLLTTSDSPGDAAVTTSGVWQRDLPTVTSWHRVAVAAAILVTLVVTAQEVSLRRSGVIPSVSMQPGLWAWQRNLVREAPQDSTVLLGSSRMAFGFDQDEWVRCGGTSRPFMLAWPGSCPWPVLRDMARDESFRGTLLVGVTPELFFCHSEDRFPMRIENLVKLSRNWGPADDIEQRCGFLVQPRLAVLVQGVMAGLPWLRDQSVLPQRTGQMPPLRYIQWVLMDEHCRMRMVEDFPRRPDLMRTVQHGWLADHQRNLSPKGEAEPIVRQVMRDVTAIEKRGGTVIFVRFPSTDWYREHERRHVPRKQFWDRLIDETGCLGIHFEDHDELRDFDCPEWSHLTQEDAILFTRRLYAIIDQAQRKAR